MKTYAIDDIHGAYKALMQCSERAQFDYVRDRFNILLVKLIHLSGSGGYIAHHLFDQPVHIYDKGPVLILIN